MPTPRRIALFAATALCFNDGGGTRKRLAGGGRRQYQRRRLLTSCRGNGGGGRLRRFRGRRSCLALQTPKSPGLTRLGPDARGGFRAAGAARIDAGAAGFATGPAFWHWCHLPPLAALSMPRRTVSHATVLAGARQGARAKVTPFLARRPGVVASSPPAGRVVSDNGVRSVVELPKRDGGGGKRAGAKIATGLLWRPS